MPYYISQPKATHLKKSFCVEPLPNEIQQTLNATECLTVYDYDTAKAITCFLRNIDINDSPQTLVLRLANIVSNLNNVNNISTPYYQIEYKLGINSRKKLVTSI
ncbi:MAG: hypothetical protein U0L65_06225 [Bacteroidales bacterium]|nr:hypothetical protein [Bacteroidales bacterium]